MRGLRVTVLLAGSGTLALEILIGRYLHPAFGASIQIWGAVLSVTLFCLALGYQWGGWLADRLARPEARLVLHILLAAAWTGALPLFGHRLLLWSLSGGALAGPLLACFGLFAVPVTLLATVVPLGIGATLRADGARPAGAAGSLFALSTAGSIGGALAAAYLGVPLLGVSRSLFAVALLLLLSVFPALLRGTAATSGLVVLFALAAARALPPDRLGLPRLAPGVRFLERRSTRYYQLEVLEHAGTKSRILLLDGASQNQVTGPRWEKSLFEYIPRLLARAPRPAVGDRALVLGLGAGTLIRALGRQGWRVEAVEIDPEVLRVARSHFGFPRDGRYPVHLADGRAHLARAARETPGRFRLLVVDAVGAGLHPEQIYTHEAYALMRRLLAPDGLLAINFVVYARGPDSRVLRHSAATVARLFEQVELAPLEPRVGLTNVLLLARVRRGAPLLRAGDQPLAFDRTLRPLSDDWNPIGLWSVRACAEWHRRIREWLGDAALVPH